MPHAFLLVIPAQAGGASQQRSWSSSLNTSAKHSTTKKLFSVLRTRISLDPGLRRDDEQKRGDTSGSDPFYVQPYSIPTHLIRTSLKQCKEVGAYVR
ncbi:hypothetical protein [Dyella psychrodurans]|uniref:hypothetical protein n=1 Tax=Dyella psychrodurans TaxID=1927960 RepID=UPI0013147C83|nr:hypothetical protein [Dyella psychrodurans]